MEAAPIRWCHLFIVSGHVQYTRSYALSPSLPLSLNLSLSLALTLTLIFILTLPSISPVFTRTLPSSSSSLPPHLNPCHDPHPHLYLTLNLPSPSSSPLSPIHSPHPHPDQTLSTWFWGVVRGDVIAVVSRAIAIALLKLSAISSLRETLSLPAKSVPCRSTCFVRLAREARLARAALRPLQGEIDESLQIS